jgi:hypothetical protein
MQAITGKLSWTRSTWELVVTASNDSAALARPAVSRKLEKRARRIDLNDFIGAHYRRSFEFNEARRTLGFFQSAHVKTGYDPRSRFPPGLYSIHSDLIILALPSLMSSRTTTIIAALFVRLTTDFMYQLHFGIE